MALLDRLVVRAEANAMGTTLTHDGERTSHLNVRHLEIFWAVMRSGNQHEAARMLGLSQPAVSKLLRYTEQRIGFPLFSRTRGRLHPTPEARVFYNAIDGIFGRLEAAERLARDLRRQLTGRITVTTVSAFNQVLLPQAMAEFLASQPLLQVGLKVLTPADTVERVANGEADLGLTFGPLEAVVIDTHVLRLVPIVCVLPPGHALASKPVLGITDLVGQRLVTAAERPLWGRLLGEAFAAIGQRADIAVECTQSELGFALAAAGTGIAVMPAIPLMPGLGQCLVVRPLRADIQVSLLAVTGRDRPLPHAVAMLIAQLQRTAANLVWAGSDQRG